MAFSRFRLAVLLRIAALGATMALALWLALTTHYVMTIVLLVVLVLYQSWALMRTVEKTERDLTRFLGAIRYEDFFETFSGARSRSASRLHAQFSRIMQDFRTVRAQREEQVQYLETVVQHISIALISFDGEGEVEIVNAAAKRLFRVSHLRNISRLAAFSPKLVEALRSIQPGQKRVVRVVDEGELLLLSLHATEFHRRGRRLHLVTLQNIRSELEERELEAWQNLIRVLTHEIRNSITPIASLASTTGELLELVEKDLEDGSEEVEDARLAVSTIQRRSDGLLRFVEAFRSLYKVPRPEPEIVNVEALFGHIRTIFEVTLQEQGVRVSRRVQPPELSLTADPGLIEQVLINLVTNALQAMAGSGGERVLELVARIDSRGRVQLIVADSGPGIPSDELDRVFIPFYTTRGEGTGIGLSLSRQIMRLHKGTISVSSTPGEGATFTLTF